MQCGLARCLCPNSNSYETNSAELAEDLRQSLNRKRLVPLCLQRGTTCLISPVKPEITHQEQRSTAALAEPQLPKLRQNPSYTSREAKPTSSDRGICISPELLVWRHPCLVPAQRRRGRRRDPPPSPADRGSRLQSRGREELTGCSLLKSREKPRDRRKKKQNQKRRQEPWLRGQQRLAAFAQEGWPCPARPVPMASAFSLRMCGSRIPATPRSSRSVSLRGGKTPTSGKGLPCS